MEQLEGKVAVVTGGARGIGRALAEQCLAEGMQVMIGDLDEASALATADELSAVGSVRSTAVDVSDQADVDALRDATLEAFGAVHVVCNNAGVSGRRHAMAETTDADWQWVVGVNLMGVVHGIRSFAPILLAQGEGHIVNTASLAGLSAVPFASPYVATKHAVVGLSQSLALEFEASGSDVGVTVLCPDWLRTDIAESRSNWPGAELGTRPAESQDPGVQFMDALFTSAVAAAPPPDEFARKAIASVKQNRFLVLTETPLVEQALRSHRDLLEGAPPSLPS
jgi:NAD(P)-dependent dehydrogenase (short-subunit alcohol dehydrogenase family)